MIKRKKGFTLVELLVVVAVSAVLLMIASERFIIDPFKANATYNQRVDLQSGVKSSLDNVKNILKRAVQVHLVGKEVYSADMDLTKLDSRYNYIAFREDEHGNKFLANIVYDPTSRKFDVLPITASEKSDVMNNDSIKYALEFYKGDKNYNEKLEKDLLNITVTGKSDANAMGTSSSDSFELSEDILLPNVNQILVSRHLQGGIDKITAIAYDNGIIQPGRKADNRTSVVFVIDNSASMKYTMDYSYAYEQSNGSYKLSPNRSIRGRATYRNNIPTNAVSYSLADMNNPASPATTRKVILGDSLVGDSTTTGFFTQLRNMAKTKNIEIEAYIIDYHNGLVDHRTGNVNHSVSNNRNYSAKYLYDVSLLKDFGYGPYNLQLDTGFNDAKNHVLNKSNMKLTKDDHALYRNQPALGQGTNTGLAILASLELLKQIQDQGVPNRYLILLTDGDPNYFAYPNTNSGIWLTSRSVYNSTSSRPTQMGLTYQDASGLPYIRDITNSSSGNNTTGLYKKAYLIGFSSLQSQKTKLGFPDANGSIPPNSINAYMRQTNNEVQTYDAYDRTALNDALNSIVNDIGVGIGVFDGPDRMGR